MDEAIDRLYSLPLEEFTPARNALAKELGRGPDADRVKVLRKPALSAWAVNQAVRAEPGLLEALMGAGAELRQAHRQAARGAGAANLREAAAAEQEAVEALARVAAKAAGRRAGGALLDRVRETLHAAALDATAREVICAGRVVADVRVAGLGDLGSEAPGPRARRSPVARPPAGGPSRGGAARGSGRGAGGRSAPEAPEAGPPRGPDPRPLRRAVRAAEKAVASAEARAENAEEALREAKEELRGQRKRLREAQRELKKAGG